jgi:hypothetical protein
MSEEDKKHFSSFGHAQVALTNELYNYLNKPNIFIFYPTGLILVLTNYIFGF